MFADLPLLQNPAIRITYDIAKAAGGEARLVGGLVRDIILGRVPADGSLGDCDMAVSVPIEVFCQAARAQDVRIIETGLLHGSVTLLYDDTSIEVTQTRSDIETDGRHATIGFAPSFEEDAKRRDFTINALYVDKAGRLHDPLGGYEDIAHRRLRFIGNPDKRLQEDYLRMLRYFRFLATLEAFHYEPADIAAMPAHFEGLASLSGERVLTELSRLFGGKNWHYAIALMRDIGCDKALFGAPFLTPQDGPIALTSWQARLASICPGEAVKAVLSLPLSRKDARLITTLTTPIDAASYAILQTDNWHEIAHFGGCDFYERCLVQSRYHSQPLSQMRLQELAKFTAPPCPVTGHDLRERGIETGPELGRLLAQAERIFVQSAYQLGRDDILGLLTDEDES